jgi:hypothetical protein
MIGESLEKITYTKTSDRSVTGNMNDMVHMLKYFNMTEDELSLCARINHTPYSRGKFYSNIKNLVLWARSEFNGSAK